MRRNRRVKRMPKGNPAPLEKEVQRKIKSAALDLGFDVMDMSQPRASMMPVGMPDLYLRHHAKKYRCWVEVKRPGSGVVSNAQSAWILFERECGGIAFVADSIERFIHQLHEYGFPVTIQ